MTRPTRETESGRAYLDLQTQARRQQRPTQELLTLYALERWLARLEASAYAGDFVLKGGMLLAALGARPGLPALTRSLRTELPLRRLRRRH